MAVTRRIFKQGNSKVISIPEYVLDYCDMKEGDYFQISVIPGPAVLLKPWVKPKKLRYPPQE